MILPTQYGMLTTPETEAPKFAQAGGIPGVGARRARCHGRSGAIAWCGEQGSRMRDAAPLPARIGPAEFSLLGKLVAIRAPRELDAIFRRAGGAWEPGSRRWL